MAQARQEAWVAQTLGERIGLIRRRRRLSQTDLARAMTALGLTTHQTTVAGYEAGRRKPSIWQLLAMAGILDVTLSDLGVTDEDYPELKLLRDPDLASHIAWPVKSRRDQRLLAPVLSP